MLDIRYVAGIIDGEGHIGFGMFHEKQLHVKLKVHMTHLGLLEELQKQFGGSLTKCKDEGNRKQSYSWQLSCEPALVVIRQIQEYLIVKREQANLVIMFDKLGNNIDKTVNYTFKTLMHKYNKRGPG